VKLKISKISYNSAKNKVDISWQAVLHVLCIISYAKNIISGFSSDQAIKHVFCTLYDSVGPESQTEPKLPVFTCGGTLLLSQGPFTMISALNFYVYKSWFTQYII
jgi:hypothetical protein